jgi:hypothetical protein
MSPKGIAKHSEGKWSCVAWARRMVRSPSFKSAPVSTLEAWPVDTGTSPLRYQSSFRLIWPSSGSFGKACLVRAHLLLVVVERFRRGAKSSRAQAAAQGLALELEECIGSTAHCNPSLAKWQGYRI